MTLAVGAFGLALTLAAVGVTIFANNTWDGSRNLAEPEDILFVGGSFTILASLLTSWWH